MTTKAATMIIDAFVLRALLAGLIVAVAAGPLGLSLIHISEPTRPY